jgi:hypothetical protein
MTRVETVAKGFKRYSAQHLWSAAIMTSLLPPLEQVSEEIRAEVGQNNFTRLLSYRAFVTGAIFSSVGFLEASINELFFMAGEPLGGALLGLQHQDLAVLAEAVPLVLRRRGLSTLDKFQLTLVLTRKAKFDPGVQPYANAALLIALRNELIHYVPEWTLVGEPQKIVARLAAAKFSLNPLEPEALGEHLDRYLSYGCARWAVESCMDFADEFYRRLGVGAEYREVNPPPRSLLP